ncbi:hypothetical protein [Kutzneria buriramensis]|uniref:Uncharacterized protein n=1 Tax=Kutzneria buriramensis TaxID=1045776 RepID=A0A3E0GWG9_9PSEU|nr:hypothetical protein [Kutzneria buriramensis]REH30708.1 hypothetical protein BCF44_12366 [Kutzneria buriramensis]
MVPSEVTGAANAVHRYGAIQVDLCIRPSAVLGERLRRPSRKLLALTGAASVELARKKVTALTAAANAVPPQQRKAEAVKKPPNRRARLC